MNSVLAKCAIETTTMINRDMLNGIAKPVFKTIPQYLSIIFQDSLKTLNKNIPFKFVGYRRTIPEEELLESVYSKTNYRVADISRNSVVLYRYMFEYNHIPLNIYLYLPFAIRGNIFQTSGTNWVVTPVVTDLILSISPTEIFVRLHKAKIKFTSTAKRMLLNESETPELFRLVRTKILNGNKNNGSKDPLVGCMLYPLCRYGFDYTISKYLGLSRDDIFIKYDRDNKYQEQYKGEYDVYRTIGIKPKYYDGVYYKPHGIKVFIKKSITITPVINNLITTVISSFDMVNGYIERNLHNSLENRNLRDEIFTWRELLGRLSFKSDVSKDKLMEDVNLHIDALEDYMDSVLTQQLKDGGKTYRNKTIEEFWDLITYVSDVYAELTSKSREYNGDIDNIYLGLHYYICYNLIIGFNKAVKSLNQRYNKAKVPSYEEARKTLTVELGSKEILKLTKSGRASLALTAAETPGDCFYFKLTGLLENQNRGNGPMKGGNTQFPEATKILKPVDLYYGSALWLIKSAPTPTLRYNLFCNVDMYSGRVLLTKQDELVCKKIDSVLRGTCVVDEDVLSTVLELTQDEELIKEVERNNND